MRKYRAHECYTYILRLPAMDQLNITVKNIRQKKNRNICSNIGNYKQHFETNIGPEIFNDTST